MVTGTMRMMMPTALALAAALTPVAGATALEAQRTTAPTFTWEGAVAAGRTLEIKGVNGSINAVVAPGNTTRVDAVRSGRRNDPNEVRIEVVEHPGGVTICAVYPSSLLNRNECRPGDEGRIGARNNDVSVEFTIEVPASVDLRALTSNGAIAVENLGGRVEARSTNGDVRIDGGRSVVARTTNGSVRIRSVGEATASTTNGRIEAELGEITGGGPLDFSTTNGSVTLRLPAQVDATIDAATSNGGISTDFPLTVQGQLVRSRLTGNLGNGGREIRLRTTNGSIRLERAG